MNKNLVDALTEEESDVTSEQVIDELNKSVSDFKATPERVKMHDDSMSFLDRIHAEIRMKNEGHRPLMVDKVEDEE